MNGTTLPRTVTDAWRAELVHRDVAGLFPKGTDLRLVWDGKTVWAALFGSAEVPLPLYGGGQFLWPRCGAEHLAAPITGERSAVWVGATEVRLPPSRLRCFQKAEEELPHSEMSPRLPLESVPSNLVPGP